MALEEDTAWIIWPEYFDSRRSRAEGRRVRKDLSVSSPNVEGIAKALEKLKLEFRVESEKAYPSNWWRGQGRVLVENSMPKSELLIKIAQNLPKE